MAVILYRCPNTGFRVQGWFEDRPENGDETYETVACTACGQLHLVSPVTGKTLGADEE